ncbi:MAG TPA: histidine kinase [Usitatibacter sp.]|nr:histidine kinase [Usitatibacter sp.]
MLPHDASMAPWVLWDRWVRSFAFAIPMFVLVIKTELHTAPWDPKARIAALGLVLVIKTELHTAPWDPKARIAALGLALVVGAAAYTSLRVAYFASCLLPASLLTALLYFAARERDAALRLHRASLARVEIERQLVESRLNVLRAQIEPHFRFNSLASVKLLYGRNARKGRALLRDLADYLRKGTCRARQREVPLGDEVALARTFLGIFQVRMGKRLLVDVDVPADLDSALVPALTIGTLVENAIKHGIGPRAAGGTVRLTSRSDGGYLVVGVHDDGVGFRARSGSGVGLANIRARLETLLGPAGTLELASNSAGGVTATLRLPYHAATAE